MKRQTLDQMDKKLKEKESIRKDKTIEERREGAKKEAKKWKGKDWFAILAPKMFGEIPLYETPTTDPNMLIGRNIQIFLPDITGDKKNHMKLIFRVTEVKDKKAHTTFNGYLCNREFIARGLRRGLSKIDLTDYIDTKDNWRLQITISSIINKNKTSIQTGVRKFISSMMKDAAKESTVEDFVKGVIGSLYQKRIRKEGSKTYPIRFAEISKIEVIKPGEATPGEAKDISVQQALKPQEAK